MAEHTPGPWITSEDGYVTAFHNDGSIDETICCLTGAKLDAACFSDVPGRIEANARLIAQSPAVRDLLDELLSTTLDKQWAEGEDLREDEMDLRIRCLSVFMSISGE
jgi:hypothetical protein